MEDSTVNKDKHAPRAAVALKYSGKDRAPEVIASGVGDAAQQILRLAKESGVKISNSDSLGDILSKLDIDNGIPADAFPVVAEVLAFLYRADSSFTGSNKA